MKHMFTIAVKHDFRRQGFKFTQRNVRRADTRDGLDLHKAGCSEGDETLATLKPSDGVRMKNIIK